MPRPTLCDLQYEVVAVLFDWLAGHPGRPAQLPDLAGLHLGNLGGLEDELHLEAELVADVVSHPVVQSFEAPAAGEQTLVVLEPHRAHLDPELLLALPDLR